MGEIAKADVDRRIADGAKIFGFVPCNAKHQPSGQPIYFETADEATALDWLEIWKETGRIEDAAFYQILHMKPGYPVL